MVKDSFSDILDGVDLPTDEQVRKETIRALKQIHTSSAEWTEQHQAGIDKRANNPEWKKNVVAGNRQRAGDPTIVAKLKETLRQKKLSDPEGHKKRMIDNAAQNKKPVQTPDGVFDSRRRAARFYGKVDSWIKWKIDNHDDWNWITCEEYNLLKEKDTL